MGKLLVSVLLSLSLVSCATKDKTASVKTEPVSVWVDPDLTSKDEFVVVKTCYQMVIKKVETCLKGSDYCYGEASFKSNPNKLTYTTMQPGRKKGAEFEYCYIHAKTDNRLIDSFFIPESDPESKK